MSDVHEDGGIHVSPHKTHNSTGTRLVITWSDELRDAVAMAKAVRPVKLSPVLFCKRRSKCYFDESTGTAGGWDSMWRGFMNRVMAETRVEQRFNEHDLGPSAQATP